MNTDAADEERLERVSRLTSPVVPGVSPGGPDLSCLLFQAMSKAMVVPTGGPAVEGGAACSPGRAIDGDCCLCRGSPTACAASMASRMPPMSAAGNPWLGDAWVRGLRRGSCCCDPSASSTRVARGSWAKRWGGACRKGGWGPWADCGGGSSAAGPGTGRGRGGGCGCCALGLAPGCGAVGSPNSLLYERSTRRRCTSARLHGGSRWSHFAGGRWGCGRARVLLIPST